jgi:hypothetical protein
MMKKSADSIVRSVIIVLAVLLAAGTSFAEPPKFRVLAFYSLEVEKAHVEFALDAIKFFNELARQERFAFDTTSLMSDLKDIVPDGDLPVVWSNTKYKMLYMNMGHGNLIFSDPVQNRLMTNSVLYFRTLLSKPAKNP